MQQVRFLFAMALLYMFRVTISLIIRSRMLYMATGELAHCKLTNSICCILLELFHHYKLNKFPYHKKHSFTCSLNKFCCTSNLLKNLWCISSYR